MVRGDVGAVRLLLMQALQLQSALANCLAFM